jgi:glycosyltransferase involved in cell wall biosynthesis
MGDESADVWVVIPAYNEGPVISDVVRAVRTCFRNTVVVDDRSSDDTSAAALAGGAIVVRHPINLGQGAALQTGIRYALSRGAAYVVTFDGDGQHRVDDIDALLAMQKHSMADVVIGSRFLGTTENLPALRGLVLKLAVRFTRLTSGVKVTDAHNGLRLLTRHAAQQIEIRQNRMAHASEIIDQIRRLGLSIAEAPVRVVYTEYSLRKGQKLSNAFNILSDLFVARLNK